MLLILLPSKIELEPAVERPRSCDVASTLRSNVESRGQDGIDLKLGELFEETIGFETGLERAEEEVE